MSFTSLLFAFFLPTVLLCYYLLRRRFLLQNYLLIAASYVFYAAWDWRFSLMMTWITLVDYFCAKGMLGASAPKRRILLATSVLSNLGLLCTFKYLGFFQSSVTGLLSSFGLQAGWPLVHLILPIGLSFIVFESMSYTIDVFRGDMEPDFNLSSYALFVSFFPKLVAGPIIRAHTLLRQIERPRVIRPSLLTFGAGSILIGFLLKLVVANNISPIVDYLFSDSPHISGPNAVLGVYGFAFQIFADFAGYSSIAIGIAALMGFTLPINFKQPYLVGSPQAFWRTWHISLSTWLQDYLYISLGGNRGGPVRTYRNLLVTMLLGGLWHGASWTFVLWGAYHGALLIAHRATRNVAAAFRRSRTWAILAVVGMFQLTCLGWLLFRARSLAQVADFLRALPTGWGAPAPAAASVVGAGAVVLGYQALQRARGDNFAVDLKSPVRQFGVFLAAYLAIAWFGNFGIRTFIYFQF